MTPPRTLLVDLRAAQFDEDRGVASYVQNLASALTRTAADRRWLLLHDATRPAPALVNELATRGEWCTAAQAAAAPIDAVVTSCFFLPHHASGGRDVLPPWLLALSPRRYGVVFDLVPWLFPDRYLAGERARRRYREGLSLLRGSDHVFGISRSTCDDVIRCVGVDPRRVHPIGGDIDEAKKLLMARPAAATADVPARFGLVGPYCVTVGGDEWRKNLDTLVRAFAMFRLHHPRHQLAIVCRLAPERVAELRRLAESLGLPARAVVCTGYVTDHDLVGLMRHATLMVYPSLYEGLGLPVLEAYGCGVPATGSATSSIGELVIPELAFDPADPGGIATAMRRVVGEPAVAASSLAFGRSLLARLGWTRAAETMLQVIDGRSRGPQPSKSRRLAVVAALPPARTAIAACTVRHLQSSHWRTDFYDANPGPRVAALTGLAAGTRILPVEVLRPALDRGRHATVVYVLGNSEHHVKVLEAMMHTRSIPGVRRLAYLHEANLTSAFRFWRGAAIDDLPRPEPGAGGPAWIRRAIAEFPGMGRCLRFLAERAELDGLIVNSAACRDLVIAATGSLAARWTIDVALLPVAEVDAAAAAARARADELVVGTFGIGGDGKRLDCVARSLAHLVRRRPARLVMAGWNMADYARRIGIASLPFVEIHDQPDDDEMRRLMRSVDVAVQLRQTTHGESSGAVGELLASGTPVVVTGEGSFAELPPRLTTRVAADCPPEALADAIERAASSRVGGAELAAALAPLSAAAFTRRFAEIIAA